MNEKQKSRYLAFIANFVDQLCKETDLDRDAATTVAALAAATLLGTVLHLRPDEDEERDEYVVAVLKMVIERFYPEQREPVPDVFRQAFEKSE